ncbi:serine acetyltransferase, partial [Escherichia coli]|nr:serine acetyltransferase [Escherichia coli]EGZ1766121.1 serine acetyltransferase [Escherichia coli]EIG5682371.1 serine acetyltransferase [Escherichia coli]EIG6772792.1 serine acetyltransferase [Escherichia coli]EIG8277610.1 serine acetyltransferase [Escherichia coli]
MLCYLIAIHFVIFGNSKALLSYWMAEIIRREKMDVWRLLREKKQRNRNFLFWWRLANEMYINGNKLHKKAARKLNNNIINRFGCEIGLGANIGKGLTIPHHTGIVVHFAVDAGENLVLRQNTTIGQVDGDMPGSRVKIGNN